MSLLSARLIVFFASAAVLVIETLATRLLAPYIGVSLETFTGVIGTVLAGISVGSWMGGRLADRGDPSRLLGPIFILGGLTAMASPTIVTMVGPAFTGANPVSIVVITALAFFLPATVLSAINPVIVKIRLESLANTGEVVGSFSAVGTAGAIVGTFLTGFVLLATIPTRPVVLGIGVLLILTGVGFSIRRGRSVVGAILGTLILGGLLLTVTGPCEWETAYACARVEADPENESGRILWLDRLRHSYIDLEDPEVLEFRYIRDFAGVIEATSDPGAIDVLSIGGGGFTMPRYLSSIRPGTENTVLEIDDALIEIATTELGLETTEMTIITEDARTALRGLPDDSFDMIIGDAFSGTSVPWHLTTVEFAQQLDERLRDTGTYVLNIIDYGDLDLVRSVLATLEQVFTSVAVAAPPEYLAGSDGGNFVVIAGHQPIDTDALNQTLDAMASRSITITDDELDVFIADARPLTDDFAPVDQMIDRPEF
ncbi:MAG: spermidine synthase [Acidimicrobiia bacterium]|nr:spermidine synthase [Acidimicrobiia bacterium]